MKVIVSKDFNELGRKSGEYAVKLLKKIIAEKGEARLLLSTGASQFATIEALVNSDVDFSKVTMFHLDEYIGLPITHPASFRKYLMERFTSRINLKAAYFVDGEGDIKTHLKELSVLINEQQIDLGLIGIGENGHIAFNDPPADFDTDEAYIVVDLDDDCKTQQVGEGWFASLDDVPMQAISMTVKKIMDCKTIISCVPHKVKAKAVADTLTSELTNMIPATILRQHDDVTLFIDENSASLLSPDTLATFK